MYTKLVQTHPKIVLSLIVIISIITLGAVDYLTKTILIRQLIRIGIYLIQIRVCQRWVLIQNPNNQIAKHLWHRPDFLVIVVLLMLLTFI